MEPSPTTIREEGEQQACAECGHSLTPLQTWHVQRPCERCGKTAYLAQPGKNGRGLSIEKGDKVTAPQGTIRISLDPEKATGRFTRAGVSWFVKKLLLDGSTSQPPTSPDDFAGLRQSYVDAADEILNNSPLLAGLDLEDEADAAAAIEKLIANKDTREWWAMIVGSYNLIVEEAIAQGDALQAAWAMGILTNARAMLIYQSHMEELLWRGYRLGNLRGLLDTWKRENGNDDEEYWQKLFSENAIILSQVFSFPVVLLEGKAYVGGQGVEGSKGKIVDFLFKNTLTENTALVEIKTPQTQLLNKTAYRKGVYSPYKELTGAVAQVTNYKATLIRSYANLIEDSEKRFFAFNPPCIVIAGTQTQFSSTDHRRSFELYRHSLKDVQVVTFDELFAKIEVLVNLLEATKPTRADQNGMPLFVAPIELR